MKKIEFENGRFVLSDEGERVVLLDCGDLCFNKSRMPFQTDTNAPTVAQLLSELLDQHNKMDPDGIFDSAYAVLLRNVLLTACLVRSAVPFRVAEIGAMDGIVSFHLATLMGKLNPESMLCCVCNVIGNESESRWLDKIVQVEQPPRLSLVTAEFEETLLASEYFDIVFINGAARFGKPYESLREAARLLKKRGTIFCHAKNALQLENSFRLFFPERREYEISPQEHILVAYDVETPWGMEQTQSLEADVKKLQEAIRQAVNSGAEKKVLRRMIREVDQLVDRAVKEYDPEKKKSLLLLKERLLDYMLSAGGELHSFYKEQLIFAIEENNAGGN